MSDRNRTLPDAGVSLPEGHLLARRYEIRRKIGSGRSGTVHLGFDRVRSEEVAINVLPSKLAADAQAVATIKAAIELGRRLDHPAILTIHELQHDGGLSFWTTEPFEGNMLRDQMDARWAAGRRFAIDEILRIGEELCDALGYAHRLTAHGCVNPETILLGDDGTVRLVDLGFGQLRQSPELEAGGASIRDVPYLAPERLRGTPDVGARADQYATAAVLYEMVTGEAPVGRLQAARRRRPGTPRYMSDALDRALASDPADRFPDMAAFGAALTGRPVGRRGSRALVAMAVLAIVLLIAGGVTFLRWRGSRRPLLESAQSNLNAQGAAETARSQALAAAARWRHLADTASALDDPGGASLAHEAWLAGGRHFESQQYQEAEASFRRASELYEALVTAGTARLDEDPTTIAAAARSLLGELGRRERALNARVEDAELKVRQAEDDSRSARNNEQRQAAEARLNAARVELDLMSRLKSLAGAHVFRVSLRTEINRQLDRADRQVEAGSSREALRAYADTKSRLEELLSWPELAEATLRERSAASRGIEQFRVSLGPIAMTFSGIGPALDDAAAFLSQADRELADGRAATASKLLGSARESIATVTTDATAGLLLQARAAHGEAKPSAAVLALDELLVLDPQNADAQALRGDIAFHRLTNSIGMELVFIPPGDFLMGSPVGESGRDEDERQRRVRLTAGFYMGATEVTQSQWFAVMQTHPSQWKGDDLPVEQVTWEEALEFCRRIGEREGRVYRLPTEAEWEYACRAGTTAPFAFGETISIDQANFDGEPVGGNVGGGPGGNASAGSGGNAGEGAFRGQTTPAAGFPPNAWGLYDMHGNVWEWCPDGYEDYPPNAVIRTTGKPPVEGRILRGGSWRSRPRYLRCANRVRDTEGSRLNNIGFRVVMETE